MSENTTPPRGHDRSGVHLTASAEIVETPEMRAFRRILVDVTEALRDDLASRLEKANKETDTQIAGVNRTLKTLAPRWAVIALAIVQIATIVFLWYTLGR